MPPGADAVVMVEKTEVTGDRVEVGAEIAPGNHVRRAGEDVRPGDVVIEDGTVVTPAHLGVLLSVGCSSVAVIPRPRVGVISTGDELVADGGPLRPGQIVDSNRPTLLALVESAGFTAVDRGLVADDEDAITEALSAAAAECDAVVTSGGVSMGDFDYVKVVLDRIGEMRWMQVAIKPAKPLAVGTIGATPVFGLPGNPVSSMVSFELFARPALRRMMGHPEPDTRTVVGRAAEPLDRRADGKIHFARVRARVAPDGVIGVRSAGGQGSHQLSAMASADALAVLPDGDGVDTGGEVDLIVLGELPSRAG
jgi:molybdenum cofactor synthesis domain-containing protein